MGCNIFIIDESYCCFMRLMSSEDLGNVNPRNEIIRVYVECDY